jgi:hypothetical protein
MPQHIPEHEFELAGREGSRQAVGGPTVSTKLGSEEIADIVAQTWREKEGAKLTSEEIANIVAQAFAPAVGPLVGPPPGEVRWGLDAYRANLAVDAARAIPQGADSDVEYHTRLIDNIDRLKNMGVEFPEVGISPWLSYPKDIKAINVSLQEQLQTARFPQEGPGVGGATVNILAAYEDLVKTGAAAATVSVQTIFPGTQEVEEKAARFREEGMGFFEASLKAYTESDLPSSPVNIGLLIPFAEYIGMEDVSIPLPFGRSLGDIDFGVKGALELVTDVSNFVFLGGGSAVRAGGLTGVRAFTRKGTQALSDSINIQLAAKRGQTLEQWKAAVAADRSKYQADAAFARQFPEQFPESTLTPRGKFDGNILGLREHITPFLTRRQEIANIVTDFRLKHFRFGTSRTVAYHPEVNSIFDELKRATPMVEAQAVRFSNVHEAAVRKVFNFVEEWEVTPKGRLGRLRQRVTRDPSVGRAKTGRGVLGLEGKDPTIKGAPALADIAARWPNYVNHLTPAQREVMEALRADMGEYINLNALVGRDVGFGPASDILPDGWYLPRGAPLKDGKRMVEEEGLATAGRAVPGHRLTRLFKSQSLGIAEGYQYPSLREALGHYAIREGEDITMQHASNALLSTGLGLTTSELMPSGMLRRVKALKGSIRSAKWTQRHQRVRTGTYYREAVRQERRAGEGVSRAEKATDRVKARAALFDKEDLRKARADVRATITEAVKLANEVKKEATLLGKAKIALRAADQALYSDFQSLLTEMQKVATEMNTLMAKVPAGPMTPENQKALFALYKRHEKLDNSLDALFSQADEMFRRVDELILSGDLSRKLEREGRSQAVELRRVERGMVNQQRMLETAKRELRMLEAEVKRLDKVAGAGRTRLDAAATRQIVTATKEGKFSAQLDAMAEEWQKAKHIAERHTGRGNIPALAGLNQRSFPLAISRAANKHLKDKKPILGDELQAANTLYRAMNATLDSSGAGIQGMLGWYSNPRATAKALSASMKAFGHEGDQILGKWILDFDADRAIDGLPTSKDWASQGVRLGGPLTEYQFGQGMASGLANLPGIKQANMAFGTMGDTLRLGWANDLLRQEMNGLSTGKTRTLQELKDAGVLVDIARVANRMTGWTEGKAFGSLGDLLLFAPKFLQSRFETVGMALAATRPGATVGQRAAQQALFRMMSYGTSLTFLANYLCGNETDIRPMRGKGPNPNFMKVRCMGRDWSFFGPWGALMRASILLTGSRPGDALASLDALRGLGSGAVATTWDLLFNHGEDFEGKRIWKEGELVSQESAKLASLYILKVMAPFGAEELPEIAETYIGDIFEGKDAGKKVAGVIGGVAATLGEAFGIGSAFLTRSEARAEARATVMDELGIPGKYEDLDPPKQDRINSAPRVIKAQRDLERHRRERGSEHQEYLDEFTDIDDKYEALIAGAAEGHGPGKAFRLALGKHQSDRAVERGVLAEDSRYEETRKYFEELDPKGSTFNIALTGYIERVSDPSLYDEVRVEYDFKERDRRLEEVRRRYGSDLIDDVIAHLKKDDHPLVQELTAAREMLKPFFSMTKDTLEDAGMLGLYEEYLELDPGMPRELFRRENKDFNKALIDISKYKQGYLRKNKDIDQALVTWGYADDYVNLDNRREELSRLLKGDKGGRQ